MASRQAAVRDWHARFSPSAGGQAPAPLGEVLLSVRAQFPGDPEMLRAMAVGNDDFPGGDGP